MKDKLYELRLPIILISEIILVFLFGHLVPDNAKALFFAISLTLKGGLLTILPFIIFTFLLYSMCELKNSAISFVILAFLAVMGSNFISTSLAGFLGHMGLSQFGNMTFVASEVAEMLPMWEIHFPTLIPNEVALFAGLGIGIILSLFPKLRAKGYVSFMHYIAVWFLQKLFIPLIPLFVFGFLLKMEHDQILDVIIKDYFTILLMICSLALSYIFLLYGMAAGFNPAKWFLAMKNMFPAMITGFSSMSSASALPLIITGVEKNTKHHYGASVAPITVNVHLIGDCFALPIFAMAIMLSFGMELPSFEQYLLFTVFFVLAKFAVAAVPGGGVLVMLPIMEKYLGFTGEMLSLITAIYILFDPIITSCNVFGNGAFAMHFSKLYQFLCVKRKA